MAEEHLGIDQLLWLQLCDVKRVVVIHCDPLTIGVQNPAIQVEIITNQHYFLYFLFCMLTQQETDSKLGYTGNEWHMRPFFRDSSLVSRVCLLPPPINEQPRTKSPSGSLLPCNLHLGILPPLRRGFAQC